MSRDQRRDPRAKTDQQIWLEGQQTRLQGHAQNISKSGMFIVASGESPDVGAQVDIRFDDPEEGKVEIRMEVVWRSGGGTGAGMGLRALEPTDKTAFERVVVRHLEQQRADPQRREPDPDDEP